MTFNAKNIPHGFWGAAAMFLILLALTILLLADDLLLFVLFDNFGGTQVDFSLRLTAALVLTILNIGLAIVAFGVFKKKPETGAEAMIGARAVVARTTATETWVKVHGELWRAQCPQMLRKDEEVIIAGMDGLTLHVEKPQLRMAD